MESHEFTERELETMLMKIRQDKKKKKKRMKTSKKALLAYFIVCGILVSFTTLMFYFEKYSSALNTLAEAGLKGLPVVYGIYQANSYLINKKHMEENYIPDYDEREGLK